MSKRTSLLEYEVLNNDVFYRCHHILDYIEKHPNLPELEKESIKAAIMDALVHTKQIDPNKESLDFETLTIVDNLDYYRYEKFPNITGIPLWMKEKFREKSLYITGGIPISLCIAKPPSKISRYCVYDPNTAVSAIFNDATFYNVIYTSPTRGVRLTETRPFVEVDIEGEKYLVDILTKRILKSTWFQQTYDMEIKDKTVISKLDSKRRKQYNEMVSEHKALAEIVTMISPIMDFESPELAEYRYELEQSKKYFPDEWERQKEIEAEFNMFREADLTFLKKFESPKQDEE